MALRSIDETFSLNIARCSLDRRYRSVNAAYARSVLACAPEDANGRRIADLIGAAASAVLEPFVTRALAGEAVELGTTLEFKSVGQRTVQISLIPDHSADGNVTGWLEVINDVTERHQVERRLHQRDREFKTLVENAPDIIARLDNELRYLYVNQAIRTALGMNPAAFVGRSGAELGLPASMLAASEAAATAAFSQGQEQPASFDVRRGDDGGELRYFSARLIPEFDLGGTRVESVLMVVYDITDRTCAQLERDRLHAAERTARERAESAARARDQFLAIVSHELRSPLNGIQNWSNVLEGQMGATAPKVMWRALAGIKSGVDQQVRLIDDLLDATRVMSGNLSLATQVIEIRPVVEAAVASVRAAAAAKNIALVSDLQLGGEQLRGDPDRIQQIIWNLLSNALKFTPPDGHVRVSLDRIGTHLRLVVADDGKGIDADFLPLMFDWFRRDETSSQRGQDGLGLGLTMVRHLCELHGGQVIATSAGPGKGASFEVRLPMLFGTGTTDASRPAEIGDARRPFPSLEGLRVIAIDDQPLALEALSALLSGMQAQVWSFSSGDAAIRWLASQATASADVVLCDIAMPGEDGYATLARLRQQETERGIGLAQRLPVIALTAFAQREDRQRAVDSGFAMHLAKPVSAEELAAAVVAVSASAARR
ncbi:MAG: PAS domain-containing hybrid sensor histidine kinase/response regulator [Panacagrimonas sp.]